MKDQKAFLFIPDDPRLRARAFQIAEQRRHSLRKREQRRAEADPAALDTSVEEQMSLFAALSAVATDQEHHEAWDDDQVDDDLELADDDPALELTLAAAPAGRRSPLDRRPRHRHRRRRRPHPARTSAASASRTPSSWSLLVRRTGQSHAQVNAELNRERHRPHHRGHGAPAANEAPKPPNAGPSARLTRSSGVSRRPSGGGEPSDTPRSDAHRSR